jgi:hypothetical protein
VTAVVRRPLDGVPLDKRPPTVSRWPEYPQYRAMIHRCHNPKNDNFHGWGKKGIRVCDEWRASFHAFMAHMGPRPTPAHTIDRYPNRHGNYEPGNVRWATRSEQAYNTDRAAAVPLYTLDGVTRTLNEWATLSGVHHSTLRGRLRAKVPLAEAMRMPKIQGRKRSLTLAAMRRGG